MAALPGVVLTGRQTRSAERERADQMTILEVNLIRGQMGFSGLGGLFEEAVCE